jgi:hypothetical protein
MKTNQFLLHGVRKNTLILPKIFCLRKSVYKLVRYFFIGIFYFFIITSNVYALQKGSETVVSVEPNVTFPAIDSDNAMLAFGFFKNGFSLEDNTTSCTFDSIFPVSGLVYLNGGSLYLLTDFNFSNTTALSAAGHIHGNGHIVDFCSDIRTLADSSNDAIFEDLDLVVHSDLSIEESVRFRGDYCSLDANGKKLSFAGTGGITLENGVTLTIKDATILNVSESKICCLDNECKIVFDNVKLIQSGNLTFSLGAFEIYGKCSFVGPYTFAYQTNKTSTIYADSSLKLDTGFTFSYDPTVEACTTLLAFEDQTSYLRLDNATLHTTATGLQLTKGKLFVKGDCTFSSEREVKPILVDPVNGIYFDEIVDVGITFGDNNADNDFIYEILPSSQIKLTQGRFINKNVNESSLVASHHSSMLWIGSGTKLTLYNNLNINNGIVVLGDDTQVERADGKRLRGSVYALGTFCYRPLE